MVSFDIRKGTTTGTQAFTGISNTLRTSSSSGGSSRSVSPGGGSASSNTNFDIKKGTTVGIEAAEEIKKEIKGDSSSGGSRISTIQSQVSSGAINIGSGVGLSPSGLQSVKPTSSVGLNVQGQIPQGQIPQGQSTVELAPQRYERFRNFDFNKEDFIARTDTGGISSPGTVVKSLLLSGDVVTSLLRLDKIIPKDSILAKPVSVNKAVRTGSDILTYTFFSPFMATSGQIARELTPTTVKILESQIEIKEGVAQTNALFQASKGKATKKGVAFAISSVGKSATGQTQIGTTITGGSTIKRGVNLLGKNVIKSDTIFGSFGKSVSINIPKGERIFTETISGGKTFSKNIITKRGTFSSLSKSITSGDETLFAGRSFSNKGLQTDFIGYVKKTPKSTDRFTINPPKSGIKYSPTGRNILRSQESTQIAQQQKSQIASSVGSSSFNQKTIISNALTQSSAISFNQKAKTTDTKSTQTNQKQIGLTIPKEKIKETNLVDLGSGVISGSRLNQPLLLSPTPKGKRVTRQIPIDVIKETPTQNIPPPSIILITPTKGRNTINKPPTNIIPPANNRPNLPIAPIFFSLSQRPGRASSLLGSFSPRYTPSLTARAFNLVGRPSKKALTGNVTPFERRYLLNNRKRKRKNSLGI